MQVVLWPNVAELEISESLNRIEAVKLSLVRSLEDLRHEIRHAEALVLPTRYYDADVARLLREEAGRLRWIQLISSGFEGLEKFGVPENVVVTRSGDSWSIAVAEHAFLLLLALARQLPRTVSNQMQGRWDRSYAAEMGALTGRALGIVGFGNIGQAVARLGRAFGMHTIALSRTPKPHDLLDEALPIAELHNALRRIDALVLCVPLNPQTAGLVGSAELEMLKPSSYLINVSRGAVVSSQALVEALHAGKIAGAGLDVTDPEPLPPAHPLWSAPNIIISPHVAGALGPGGRIRLARFIAQNAERVISGRPLLDVVHALSPTASGSGDSR